MQAFLKTIIVLAVSLLFSRSAFAQNYDVSGVQILMTSDQVETVLRANGYLPDAKFRVLNREKLLAEIKSDGLDVASFTSSISLEEYMITTGKAAKEYMIATNKTDQLNFDFQVKDKTTASQKLKFEEPKLKALARDGLPAGSARVLKSMAFQKDSNRETILVEFTAFPSGPRASKVTYKLDDSNISMSDFRAKAVEKYGKPNAGRAYVGDDVLKQDNIEGKEQLNIGIGRITLRHHNRSSYNKALKAAAQKAEKAFIPKSDQKGTSF